jgi:hypothetical protein
MAPSLPLRHLGMTNKSMNDNELNEVRLDCDFGGENDNENDNASDDESNRDSDGSEVRK